MTEIIREWWGVILGFLGGAMWLGKLQQDVADLKDEKLVTIEMCDEKRSGCARSNTIQFSNNAAQFIEIKQLISAVDKAGQDRHAEIMRHLMEMNR